MDKNYYKVLEVDQKASDEIIEKAYRTLAKKYHPDLQNPEKQKEYEEKMKLINEAYSILSDDYKRTTYDNELENETISRQEYQKLLEENRILKQEIEKLEQIVNHDRNNTNKQSKHRYQQYINRVLNQKYQNINVQDMKKKGNRKKGKLIFKQYRNLIITIVCIILVFILLFQIPPIKSFFVNLYEENIIIKGEKRWTKTTTKY